jgi:hypothetical protein
VQLDGGEQTGALSCPRIALNVIFAATGVAGPNVVMRDKNSPHVFIRRQADGSLRHPNTAVDRGDREIRYVHTTLEEAAAAPDVQRRARLLLAPPSAGLAAGSAVW